MTGFTPFADDAGSTSIAKLTIENGTDRIALYGSLDLTQDRQGLEHARALKAVRDQVVQILERRTDLPNEPPTAAAPRIVKNPFE